MPKTITSLGIEKIGGLYVAFKYTIIEKETEVQIESEQL